MLLANLMHFNTPVLRSPASFYWRTVFKTKTGALAVLVTTRVILFILKNPECIENLEILTNSSIHACNLGVCKYIFIFFNPCVMKKIFGNYCSRRLSLMKLRSNKL